MSNLSEAVKRIASARTELLVAFADLEIVNVSILAARIKLDEANAFLKDTRKAEDAAAS